MSRFLILGLLMLSCAAPQSIVSGSDTKNRCNVGKNYAPTFLTERKPLPAGITCLEFPMRNSERITSWFRDERHPFTPGKHSGIDVAAEPGTVVRASAPGTVTYAKMRADGTNIVQVDIGEDWSVSYAHLRLISVTEGQHVVTGQVIGLSGGAVGDPGSGPCTNGAHLHFSVRYGDALADPLAYICLD